MSRHPAVAWRTAILGGLERGHVRDPGVSAHARLVACAFAVHVDDAGKAWPSAGTLAKRSGLSVRSVQRALQELEAGGWLEVVERGGGTESTVRRIHSPCPPDTALCPSDVGATTDGRDPVPDGRDPVPTSPGGRVTGTPELDQELDQELRAASEPPVVDPLEPEFLQAGAAGLAAARAARSRTAAP